MFGKRLLLTLFLSALGSLPAATITFTFNGLVNSSAVERSLDSGTSWTTLNVGQMRATVISTSGFSGPVPTVFWTFCVEPQQGVSAGTTYTYTIDPLADAPTNVSGGMGAVKADLLRELYGRFYPMFQDPSLSVTTASALQIATWEIVRETETDVNGQLVLNLSTGLTRFQNGAANVLPTAQTMLNALQSPGGPMISDIYSIRHATAQDLAFRSEAQVPEPATAGLAIVALAAGWTIRRKQR
jgi:hypothetical protein